MDNNEGHLRKLIQGLQSADAGIRSAAESSEAGARGQQGYGQALVKFALSEQYEGAERHMAALLLKAFINEHWDLDSPSFKVIDVLCSSAFQRFWPLHLIWRSRKCPSRKVERFS